MKIAVCDDEKNYMIQFLGKMLKDVLDELHIIAEISFFTDGNQLIKKFVGGKTYDIVILDIEMPAINGKELATKLRSINSNFSLIFISSYKEEVYNTLQYHVDSFIPKDASNEFLIKELKRVICESVKENQLYHFFDIRDKNNITIKKKFPLKAIFYICCIARTCYLYTATDEYILWDKHFKFLVKKYKPLGFFEVSRGYIVNLQHISEVKNEEVILDNNQIVPMSRRKKRLLFDSISKMITLAVENDEF